MYRLTPFVTKRELSQVAMSRNVRPLTACSVVASEKRRDCVGLVTISQAPTRRQRHRHRCLCGWRKLVLLDGSDELHLDQRAFHSDSRPHCRTGRRIFRDIFFGVLTLTPKFSPSRYPRLWPSRHAPGAKLWPRPPSCAHQVECKCSIVGSVSLSIRLERCGEWA